MADKTVKHFVFSRFFLGQDPKYPHDVLDVNFLSTQLALAKNVLRSLENQTNKNFELVFLMNPKYFDNPKYEFIFSTLKDLTTLPLKFTKESEMRGLVESAYNDYDFVIQSRMDFDDFIFKNAIEDTQSKVNECENILAYGYCKGYMYFCDDRELYVHNILWIHKELSNEPLGHKSILQSLILKSPFAKNLPPIDMYGGSHGLIKLRIKKISKRKSCCIFRKYVQAKYISKRLPLF